MGWIGVYVSLGSGGGYGGNGAAAGDRLYNIENLVGSFEDDYLSGDEGANVLDGGEGNDNLQGRQGADKLIGGEGADLVTYYQSTQGVTVNFVAAIGSGGEAEGDTFSSIEDIVGTDENDTFVLDSVANTVYGDGQDGADDTDTVDYRYSTAGVNVNLQTNANAGGYAQGDLLFNVENLIGSVYTDTLVGDADKNVLDGGDGSDVLTGGAGADVLRGGGGRDAVSYTVSQSGVTVDLIGRRGSGGDAQGDTYDSIESARGSNHDDRFVLSADSNLVTGYSGSDTIDYRYSDAGINVALELGGSFGDGGYAKGDLIFDIENVTGSRFSDTIKGTDLVNILDGGAGADTLEGRSGDDRYYVDAAADKVVEAADGGSDRVYASVNYQLAAGQSVETLSTLNSASTSAIALSGNELTQAIFGNAGADRLDGKGGADTLTGYGGNDTFLFTTTLNANDRINDFRPVDDTIQLARSIVTALPAGGLSQDAFKDLGVAGAAVDANDRILYNRTTGVLSYDADGSGTASAAQQFAILNNKAVLTFQDVLVA